MPKLRIIHLTSSLKGGAGIAAACLSDIQNERGDKSFLLTRNSKEKSNQLNLDATFTKVALSKINTLFSNAVAKGNYGQITPLSIGFPIGETISEFRPDILHVHNWYNLINLSQFKDLNKIAPIVFTLHDFRIFTGGCHYTIECKNFLQNCTKCPATFSPFHSKIKSSRTRTEDIISTLPNYGIVSPSNWQLEAALSSRILQNAKTIRNIPNKVTINQTINLEKKPKFTKTRVFFVAAQPLVAVKGLKFALSAFTQEYLRNNGLELIIVGDITSELAELTSENSEIRLMGARNNAYVFEGARQGDILFIASYSENSPNIITEAQLSGILVVGIDIAGTNEMIENNVTGFLCDRNVQKVRARIAEIIISDYSQTTKAAHERASKRNNSETIYQSHKTIYDSLS